MNHCEESEGIHVLKRNGEDKNKKVGENNIKAVTASQVLAA